MMEINLIIAYKIIYFLIIQSSVALDNVIKVGKCLHIAVTVYFCICLGVNGKIGLSPVVDNNLIRYSFKIKLT